MSEFANNLEKVRSGYRVSWSEDRARSVRFEVIRRTRRRTQPGTVVAVGLSLGAFATAFIALWMGFPASRDLELNVSSRVDEPRLVKGRGATLSLLDGSIARLLKADTELRVQRDEANQVKLELIAGGARFDVVPRSARQFVVQSRDVWLNVLGTRFVLETVGPQVRILVEKGPLHVSWHGGDDTLTTGESGLYPPQGKVPQPEPPQPPGPRPHRKASGTEAQAWRSLARRGEYDRAFEVLSSSHPDVQDEPADLLLAADVARLSRHPARAIEPLKRLLSKFSSDSRAPVAAFTLGRVLVDELADPRAGAEAFAIAEQLSPHGTLAADAQARQADAWRKAGDSVRAASVARRYIERHPNGPHVSVMRRLAAVPPQP